MSVTMVEGSEDALRTERADGFSGRGIMQRGGRWRWLAQTWSVDEGRMRRGSLPARRLHEQGGEEDYRCGVGTGRGVGALVGMLALDRRPVASWRDSHGK